ncbi:MULTISPECIES: hypothetical protein [Epilithonimonas]|uniref:hypothetical protein n=1 Tax=Epilithonimonas TaxID=2782229 RepID=UPI000ED78EDD|nr:MULTISPECIES: hypothetical protein [Epilithonimonas]HAP96088.1 hypothetical protein [Chryseobacterium sp.]
MNISYYDFKNLPNESQCDIIFTEGHLMSETVKNELRFVLYEISQFSVELVYSKNRIATINVYQNKAAYVN